MKKECVKRYTYVHDVAGGNARLQHMRNELLILPTHDPLVKTLQHGFGSYVRMRIRLCYFQPVFKLVLLRYNKKRLFNSVFNHKAWLAYQ